MPLLSPGVIPAPRGSCSCCAGARVRSCCSCCPSTAAMVPRAAGAPRACCSCRCSTSTPGSPCSSQVKGSQTPPRTRIPLGGAGGGVKHPRVCCWSCGRRGSGESGENKRIFGGVDKFQRVLEPCGWDSGIFPTLFVWINGAAAHAEDPSSSSSRELLESRGILVADIETFLGTVREMAAPFTRSYW